MASSPCLPPLTGKPLTREEFAQYVFSSSPITVDAGLQGKLSVEFVRRFACRRSSANARAAPAVSGSTSSSTSPCSSLSCSSFASFAASLPPLPAGAPLLPPTAVRATAILRVSSLLHGAGGVRPALLAALLDVLSGTRGGDVYQSFPRHPLQLPPVATSAKERTVLEKQGPSVLAYMLAAAAAEYAKQQQQQQTECFSPGGPKLHAACFPPSPAVSPGTGDVEKRGACGAATAAAGGGEGGGPGAAAASKVLLTLEEAATFCCGNSEAAGRLFVASCYLEVLVDILDSNTALLAELFLIPTDYFSQQQKHLPQVKGIQTSATNISVLLHDSKLRHLPRKTLHELASLFPTLDALLPAVGNLREALSFAAGYIDAELKYTAAVCPHLRAAAAAFPQRSAAQDSLRPAAAVARSRGHATAAANSPAAESTAPEATAADWPSLRAVLQQTDGSIAASALYGPTASSLKAALDAVLCCLLKTHASLLQPLLREAAVVAATLSPEAKEGEAAPARRGEEAAETGAEAAGGYTGQYDSAADGTAASSSSSSSPSCCSSVFLAFDAVSSRAEFARHLQQRFKTLQRSSLRAAAKAAAALYSMEEGAAAGEEAEEEDAAAAAGMSGLPLCDGNVLPRENSQVVEPPALQHVLEIEQRLHLLQQTVALQTALLLQLVEVADMRALLQAVEKASRSKGKKKPPSGRYLMSVGARRYSTYLYEAVKSFLAQASPLPSPRLSSSVNALSVSATGAEGGLAAAGDAAAAPRCGSDPCLDALQVLLGAVATTAAAAASFSPATAAAAASKRGGAAAAAATPAAEGLHLVVSDAKGTRETRWRMWDGWLVKQREHLGELLRAVNQQRRVPKVPKGTQDFTPQQMVVRNIVLNAVREVFLQHGGVEIDTPVFELRETLLGKYGENQKLVYDLQDQGGEQLSLRYDLTVPFARYVASHDIEKIRRFHIGKVYRRDEPQMQRGRCREFYQCDFDIAGPVALPPAADADAGTAPTAAAAGEGGRLPQARGAGGSGSGSGGLYPRMAADAEAITVLVQVLRKLQQRAGRFCVKVNHRQLLDGVLMDLCGLPAEKFAATCSSIDKLDKEPWEAVRLELLEQKGVAPHVVEAIESYILSCKGPLGLLVEELQNRLLPPVASLPPQREAGGSQTNDAPAGALTNSSGSAISSACSSSRNGGEMEGGGAAAAALREGGTGARRSGKIAAALADLRRLQEFLEAMGVQSHETAFDLSLARGLDYYTGVIFEAVLLPPSSATAAEEEKDGRENKERDVTIGVGSVGAGGRYDNLVGMFSGKNVPAVGVSVGVERLFRVVEASFGMAGVSSGSSSEHGVGGQQQQPRARQRDRTAGGGGKEEATADEKSGTKDLSAAGIAAAAPSSVAAAAASSSPATGTAVVLRESCTDVLVCAVGDNLLKTCMRLAGLLWDHGVAAEFYAAEGGTKLKRQMDYACQRRIPLLVIVGESEVERKVAKLRPLLYDADRTQQQEQQPAVEGRPGQHALLQQQQQHLGREEEEEVPWTDLASAVHAFLQRRGTSLHRTRRQVLS